MAWAQRVLVFGLLLLLAENRFAAETPDADASSSSDDEEAGGPPSDVPVRDFDAMLEKALNEAASPQSSAAAAPLSSAAAPLSAAPVGSPSQEKAAAPARSSQRGLAPQESIQDFLRELFRFNASEIAQSAQATRDLLRQANDINSHVNVANQTVAVAQVSPCKMRV